MVPIVIAAAVISLGKSNVVVSTEAASGDAEELDGGEN